LLTAKNIINSFVFQTHHPQVHYISSFKVQTQLLKDILLNYNIRFNFITLDIQGAELKALKGMEEYLPHIKYVYTEVNSNYVYENCTLVSELDEYLSKFAFKRVETSWHQAEWGDAFYIKIDS
jgi:hypothetical protein